MAPPGIQVPAQVVARVLAAYGTAGAAWLEQLPACVAAIATEWRLTDVGRPFPGARASFVAPVVRSDGTPLVLKLVPAAEWLAHEVAALSHWKGRGAIRLEAVDLARGAVVVERALPGTSLADVCIRDDRVATVSAAEVIAQLRASSATAALPTLPEVATWTAALKRTVEETRARSLGPGAATVLATASREATAVAAELVLEAGRDVVLHGDLHHHNLLASERAPWLATDPKGLVGPPQAEAAALLRNPRHFILGHPNRAALLADRVAILAERLGDDAARVAGWSYVLAVVAARWAADDGEGDAEVTRWLACADALRGVARSRGVA